MKQLNRRNRIKFTATTATQPGTFHGDTRAFQARRGLHGFLVVLFFATAILHAASDTPQWWSDAVKARLTEAGTNRPALEQALEEAPADQREGLQFLIEHMPPHDLKQLSAEFLLENLAMAYQAMLEIPWAKTIPS
jgi:hypothetical protein